MNMVELRKAVLQLLRAKGPMAFDAITEALDESDSRIGMALGFLKAKGLVESTEATGYKWAATEL